MGSRKNYTPEFKREAVRLALASNNVAATARELGIDHSVLVRWKQQLETDAERAFPGNGHPHDPELARLKRDNARLREENEILKKQWVSSAAALAEIPVHRRTPGALLRHKDVPHAGRHAERVLRLAQAAAEPAPS